MNDKFRIDQVVRLKRPKGRIVLAALLFIMLVAFISLTVAYKTYQSNLQPPSLDKSLISVTIDSGATTEQIADLLESRKVIRSDWAFEWYMRLHPVNGGLKAGTYVLSGDKSVSEVVAILSGGKVETDLVTILPGKRLDQIRSDLIKSGFSEQEVDAALDPSNYAGHPALVAKPPEASLEGYLYPDSFQKTAETSAKDIIGLALDEMNRYLTPEVLEGFTRQGLTPHQAIIIGSIVEQEVGNPNDRAQVAQVFIKRFKIGMPLGADPTAVYGAVINNQDPSIGAAIAYDSPYNTRMHAGLPPGPIGNVSEGSLQAVAFPAASDWLYFVAGDDGTTHFSKTIAEHEALTRTYCTKLCQ